MIIVGLNNLIDSATVTATAFESGQGANNIKDASPRSWRATVPSTVTIDIPQSIWQTEYYLIADSGERLTSDEDDLLIELYGLVPLVTMHRISFEKDLIVTAYFNDTIVLEKTFSQTDANGLDILTLYLGKPITLNRLSLQFLGPASIGYAWVGTWQGIDHEAFNLSDNTNDLISITQAGFAATTPKNTFRLLQVTIAKERFSDVRDFCRAIISDGVGKPRPVIINECDDIVDAMLGIMDSKKVQYDSFRTKPRRSQATIGFNEIFGSV